MQDGDTSIVTIHPGKGAADDLRGIGTTADPGEFRFGLRCYGVNITASLPDSTYLDDLLPLLPPTWEPAQPATEADHRYREIYSPTSGKQPDRSAALRALASDIEYAIAEKSPTYVFVHAGVVVVDDKVLIFPGESHAGKSTLVAALVRQGATYFSDEYAVITADGLVLPYLRQIALRNSLFFPEGRTDLSAHAPTDEELLRGVPASLIFVSRYESKATWSCEQLDRTSALIELCKNTVGFRNRPDMSFAYLNSMLEHATGYRCTRGEASDAVREILSIVRPSLG